MTYRTSLGQLPEIPAIVTLNRTGDFRSFFEGDFRLFTAKNIRTSCGQSQKMEIDKVLTLEHYTCNKVFVSRDGITAFAYVSTPPRT
jgi:hypothetical protein